MHVPREIVYQRELPIVAIVGLMHLSFLAARRKGLGRLDYATVAPAFMLFPVLVSTIGARGDGVWRMEFDGDYLGYAVGDRHTEALDFHEAMTVSDGSRTYLRTGDRKAFLVTNDYFKDSHGNYVTGTEVANRFAKWRKQQLGQVAAIDSATKTFQQVAIRSGHWPFSAMDVSR